MVTVTSHATDGGTSLLPGVYAGTTDQAVTILSHALFDDYLHTSQMLLPYSCGSNPHLLWSHVTRQIIHKLLSA